MDFNDFTHFNLNKTTTGQAQLLPPNLTGSIIKLSVPAIHNVPASLDIRLADPPADPV